MFMGPREGQWLTEGNRREIKAQSMKLFCSRLFWRKDYLKYVKIIMDQAPLGLGLAHNEKNKGREVKKGKEEKRERRENSHEREKG
ncbi:unnamed protein product [Spirodela intermedia]|uniref:Uncharacterized protein n=1 Tax=Spirodela intermedia TaxID=51605 RepID=A0A7I8IMH5_SPIIN|nr:unnamed protein product [Spirodela intermedia]CAA6658161.1 unnamed protein product [Spirodela intermedia]